LATELTYFGLWFCFENLELEAVAIDAAATNGPSNHLLKNLGMHCLGEQDFQLAEGGSARLNRFVMTRDEFQVRLMPMLDESGYELPTEEIFQSGGEMGQVEPVGELAVVPPVAAANSELL
jgi:hypothetical protein